MTGRSRLFQFISYGTLAALCAVVVGAMFHFFIQGSGALALLALAVGSVVWGLAAGALRASGLALPAIAVIVELAVAFEFKRIYVLDYASGPPPRSMEVFTESIFISDLLIVAVLAGEPPPVWWTP
jgi:hypothetical protein